MRDGPGIRERVLESTLQAAKLLAVCDLIAGFSLQICNDAPDYMVIKVGMIGDWIMVDELIQRVLDNAGVPVG